MKHQGNGAASAAPAAGRRWKTALLIVAALAAAVLAVNFGPGLFTRTLDETKLQDLYYLLKTRENYYYPHGEISRITVHHTLVIRENGQDLERLAAQLYARAMPLTEKLDNEKALVELLPVGPGRPKKIALRRTEGQERSLTVSFREDLQLWFDSEAAVTTELNSCSCLLLAVVGDLDEVVWEYDLSGESHTFRASAAYCSELLGEDIKTFGASPSAVQTLLDRIDFT